MILLLTKLMVELNNQEYGLHHQVGIPRKHIHIELFQGLLSTLQVSSWQVTYKYNIVALYLGSCFFVISLNQAISLGCIQFFLHPSQFLSVEGFSYA